MHPILPNENNSDMSFSHETLSTTPIMFHFFHSCRDSKKYDGSFSEENLVHLIQWLGARNILHPQEYVDQIEKGQVAKGATVFTFDDNLLSQHQIALPVLDYYGIKAFWFIYDDPYTKQESFFEIARFLRVKCYPSLDAYLSSLIAFAETLPRATAVFEKFKRENWQRYLSDYSFYSELDRKFRYFRDICLTYSEFKFCTEAQYSELALRKDILINELVTPPDRIKALNDQGHVIGLHSSSHPTVFSSLSRVAQIKEYNQNKQWLEGLGCDKVKTMAHPNGSYNADTLEVLSELGIRIGFRSNQNPLQNQSNLELPRLDAAILLKEVLP